MPQEVFMADEKIIIAIDYTVLKYQEYFGVMFWFYNEEGVLLFSSLDTVNPDWYHKIREVGNYTSFCKVPPFLFKTGTIFVSLYIATASQGWRFTIDEIINFVVIPSLENKKIVGDWAWAWPNVAVQPLIEWDVLYKEGL